MTGEMKTVEWKKLAPEWKHLKNLKFPTVGSKKTVDMLIGIDQAELHVAIREVRGNVGEPIARLTPLGWTCVGRIGKTKGDESVNHTANLSYFVDDEIVGSHSIESQIGCILSKKRMNYQHRREAERSTTTCRKKQKKRGDEGQDRITTDSIENRQILRGEHIKKKRHQCNERDAEFQRKQARQMKEHITSNHFMGAISGRGEFIEKEPKHLKWQS